jgi:hypothetical protein
MDAGDLLAVDTAERLAVDGQRLVRRQPLGSDPRGQGPLEGRVIERVKRPMQRRHARSAFRPQPERHADLRPTVLAPLSDGIQTATPAQQGTDRERQLPAQRMHPSLPPPHVRQCLQRRS